jgi:hypothetical protein
MLSVVLKSLFLFNCRRTPFTFSPIKRLGYYFVADLIGVALTSTPAAFQTDCIWRSAFLEIERV